MSTVYASASNTVACLNVVTNSSTEYLAAIETQPMFRSFFTLVNNAASFDATVQAEALILFDREYLLQPGFTAPSLADIVLHEKVWRVREQAIYLLNHCIGDVRLWERMTGKEKKCVKRAIFRAVHNSHRRDEVQLLARSLGYLMRYELGRQDPWMLNIFRYLQEICSCLDPEYNLSGVCIFRELAKSVPETFILHLEVNLQTFYNVLQCADKKGKWVSPIVGNMLESFRELTKYGIFNKSDSGSYKIFIDAAPLLIKALRAYMEHRDPINYHRGFNLLKELCETSPHVLNESYSGYMHLAIQLAGNDMVKVRVENIGFIAKMLTQGKHKVFRGRLLEAILHMSIDVLVNSLEHIEQDVENYVLNEEIIIIEDEKSHEKKLIVSSTIEMLRILVSNLPESLLFEEFLKTVQPALISMQKEVRRTLQVIMGNVMESLSQPLCTSNVEKLIMVSKMGVTDKFPIVRCVAFDALTSFITHLDPKILEYPNDIIPLLLRFLKQTCEGLETNSKLYLNRTHNMFTALELFCSKTSYKRLSPYISELMHWLFVLLEPPAIVALSVMSLGLIGSIADNLRHNLMPYYEPLMHKIKTYLNKFIESDGSKDLDAINLCTQAMETTSRVAVGVGQSNFSPIAEEILHLTMSAMTQKTTWDDSYMLGACYRLIAVLSEIVPGSVLKPNYSVLTKYLYNSISLHKPKTYKTQQGVNSIGQKQDNEHEKEQAIYTLMCLAKYTPDHFNSYIMGSFKRMFLLIDYPHEGIRKAVCLAATASMLASKGQNEQVRVVAMQYMLLPKLLRIVREVENMSVVQSALECLAEIIRELRESALCDNEMVKSIFECMEDILTNNAACMQDVNFENSEQLCQIAASILPDFGIGLRSPEQFSLFFGKIPHVMHKLLKNKHMRHSQRPVLYEIFINCIEPLGAFCAEYFYVFYPIIMRGLFDGDIIVRSSSCYGIGQLMYYAKAQPPAMLVDLVHIMIEIIARGESERLVLDHFCVSIASIVMTNPKIIPLHEVLPIFFDNLPTTLIMSENSRIVRSFNVLYHEYRHLVEQHIGQIIAITLTILQGDNILNDQLSTKIALRLLRKIRESHYNQFKAQVKSNPDAYSIVISLFKK